MAKDCVESCVVGTAGRFVGMRCCRALIAENVEAEGESASRCFLGDR